MLSIEESAPCFHVDPGPASLTLELEVTDPEVVDELRRHPEGRRRDDFARSALRLGILALRQAQGSLDADLVRRQGEALLARLEKAVEGALLEQRERLLSEFSLDERSSVLHRLVREVDSANGHLHRDLKDDLEAVGREFSLDNPEGALSRLRREISGVVGEMTAANDRFQHEVRSALEEIRVRREEAARSTRHGLEFESAVGEFLRLDCRARDEILEACGATPGRLPRSKKGDFTIVLGEEAAAAGAKIVVEAKEQKYYTLAMALAEIEAARRNRDAQVGLFVFSRATAPANLGPLSRHGPDVVAVWDRDDVETDVVLSAALSLVRALCVRAGDDGGLALDLGEIDDALLRIGRRAEDLEQVAAWARTIEHNGAKIRARVEGIRDELEEQVERLRLRLEGLRRGGN